MSIARAPRRFRDTGAEARSGRDDGHGEAPTDRGEDGGAHQDRVEWLDERGSAFIHHEVHHRGCDWVPASPFKNNASLVKKTSEKLDRYATSFGEFVTSSLVPANIGISDFEPMGLDAEGNENGIGGKNKIHLVKS